MADPNDTPPIGEYQYDWQNPNSKPTFDVGRVMRRTWETLRDYWQTYAIFAAVLIVIPATLFGMWPLITGFDFSALMSDDVDPDAVMEMYGAMFAGTMGLIVFFFAICSIVFQAGGIQLAFSHFNDQNLGWAGAIRAGLYKFFPFFGLGILMSLGIMAGFLLFIIPGIFLALGWVLAPYIMLIEKRGITESLGRAWELTKGYKRWILLMYIIFSVIGGVIGAILSIPVYFIGNPTTAMLEGASDSFWILNGVATGLSQAVTLVLAVVGLTAVYCEIRYVRDGVDVGGVGEIFD